MKRWLIILSATLLVLAVAIVGYQIANRPTPPVSGPIVLPDGSWAYIEAVTYGTNHLVGPPLSYVAQRLPQPMRSLMVRFLGRRAAMRFTHSTSSPKLVVWLNRGMATAFPTNLGKLECVLSDTNGFSSGNVVPFAARYPLTVMEFDAFPRRAPQINLSIYYHDATGAISKRGTVTFANPFYRNYPEWKPETLPTTKRVNDLEVTLERIHTGLNWDYIWETSPTGRAMAFTPNLLVNSSATVCAMRWHSITNTHELWRIATVTASDSTGNRVTNKTPMADEAIGYVEFSCALWNSEPAWKMGFELVRTAGLETNEQFTFANVPFGAFNSTNRLGLSTNCNGIPITLVQAVWRELPQTPNRSWPAAEFEVQIETTGSTNGLRVDMISAHTDTATELVLRSAKETETNRSYLFESPPPGAKSASFTFAVQRSVWVEFLTKPKNESVRFAVRPSSQPESLRQIGSRR